MKYQTNIDALMAYRFVKQPQMQVWDIDIAAFMIIISNLIQNIDATTYDI